MARSSLRQKPLQFLRLAVEEHMEGMFLLKQHSLQVRLFQTALSFM